VCRSIEFIGKERARKSLLGRKKPLIKELALSVEANLSLRTNEVESKTGRMVKIIIRPLQPPSDQEGISIFKFLCDKPPQLS
jgi:hypothetical protein